MGDLYLTDLADVLRAAGLTVHEDTGWQTRARSSGGYEPGRPTHVMVHNTASGPGSDPTGDVAYIARTADAAPLANLYLSRTGEVTVCAAGATNTNGSGHDSWGGGVPDDSMNTYAIGIEAANDGVGEPWPAIQQDAYLRICRALCDAYLIGVDHVRGHAEWAPDRKIDPAGPSNWAEGRDTWDLDAFRSDVDVDQPEPPEPVPDPGVIAMYLLGVKINGAPGDGIQWLRVSADLVIDEPNATALGIDQWFGIPQKVAGAGDVATLFVSRRATTPYRFAPGDPWYSPELADAWHM